MDSYEAVFEYGLGKNSTLALDYDYGRQLTKTGTSYLPAHVLQIDWNLKF
jgi:hypothetical protein